MDTKAYIQLLIEKLGLIPLPVEGGLYVQTYKSADWLEKERLPERYTCGHSLGTAIYYLLTDHPNSFSCMHVLPTDEVYHFYLGDPVEMLLLYPDGTSRHPMLGSDVPAGQLPQILAPLGVWQGSRLAPGGKFALIGTTMAPGYENSDFSLGDRLQLCRRYPQDADLIRQLTR